MLKEKKIELYESSTLIIGGIWTVKKDFANRQTF